MALKPWNDNVKVRLDKPDQYGFGVDKGGFETGVVVEVPESMQYLAMHSMVLESSFMDEDKLNRYLDALRTLIDKRVIWQSYQDRGRVYQEGDDLFVNLKMTDIMGVAESVDDAVTFVELDKFRGGSFTA